MTLFRKRNGTPTPTAADADAQPVARSCRGCGSDLEADQLACLSCGAVDAPAGGRERRWLLPTSGVAAAALLLVTSASFATTTALRTGDPKAVKEQPPAVAQAIPPASGNGSAAGSAQPEDPSKGPDLGDLPDPPASDPAPPAADAPAAPADDGAADDGTADDGGSTGSSGGSTYGGGSGSSGGSKPDKPAPKPVKVPDWPGVKPYTVVLGYKFNTKADARAKAREVKRAGLPVYLIDSDDYKSLEPGSWLVAIGQFDSAQRAERENDRYSRAGYPGEPTFVGQTEAPESEPGSGSGGGSGSGSGGGSGSGSGGGSGGGQKNPLPLP